MTIRAVTMTLVLLGLTACGADGEPTPRPAAEPRQTMGTSAREAGNSSITFRGNARIGISKGGGSIGVSGGF